jgi:hypothetical protein
MENNIDYVKQVAKNFLNYNEKHYSKFYEWLSLELIQLSFFYKDKELEYQKSVLHTRSWWALRMAKMDDWIRKNAPEDVKSQYFCILANGSSDIFDHDKTDYSIYEELLKKIDELDKENLELKLNYNKKTLTSQTLKTPLHE